MGLSNPLHIAFVAIALLLVFGAKRLPEIGRSLGAGMRGFRESVTGEVSSAAEPALLDAPPTAPSHAAAQPSRADAARSTPDPGLG
jgi:sec-independent protein translocase protein TatA